MSEPIKVFVYGSLRRGFRLLDQLSGSRFHALATIEGHLHDLGPFPALVEVESAR